MVYYFFTASMGFHCGLMEFGFHFFQDMGKNPGTCAAVELSMLLMGFIWGVSNVLKAITVGKDLWLNPKLIKQGSIGFNLF